MSIFLNWLNKWSPASTRPVRRPRSVVRSAWANRLPAYACGAARLLQNKPSLQGRHISHGFGRGEMRVQVMSDISVELQRGQMTLLMGASGCGKSTLWSILAGLQRPENGQVLVLGENIWTMAEQDLVRFRYRHFGIIFQQDKLFPALTAVQQLEMVLRWGEGATAREARRRAAAMLEQLGITGRMQSLRPAQLSGGQRQRVAIGRALIKEPDFIFADEPTAALDWEQYGKQVVELLRDAAHARNATLLVVTHDPRLIPCADRALHMDNGRLKEIDIRSAGRSNGAAVHALAH